MIRFEDYLFAFITKFSTVKINKPVHEIVLPIKLASPEGSDDLAHKSFHFSHGQIMELEEGSGQNIDL